jgi:hypothetical protein
MNFLGDVRVYQDRYGGSYSGGVWIAVDMERKTTDAARIEEGILGGDLEVMAFWREFANSQWLAVGATPNKAVATLEAKTGLRVHTNSAGLKDGD